MLGYAARRLFFALVVIWVAASLSFLLVRLAPSDPAVVLLGSNATAAELFAERERMGLNDPILVQYANFISGLLRLDLGQSMMRGGSAMGLVLSRLPNSLILGGAAMLIIVVVSVPLGLLAGRFRGRAADNVITTGSLLGQALPEFWVGLMLMLVFSRVLGLLPSGGLGGLDHLLMPALTLALPATSVMIRLVRSEMISALREEYVDTARCKGLSERVVLMQHALPNTLIPVVTVGGIKLGYLLGGTAIVETVFSWPGIGSLLVSSIGLRDFPVIQASIVVITTIVVLVNLCVDLLYGYLNPRIQVGGEE